MDWVLDALNQSHVDQEKFREEAIARFTTWNKRKDKRPLQLLPATFVQNWLRR